MNVVWHLMSRSRDREDDIYRVFSSPDRAVAWLRKARRHRSWMGSTTEPIIPTADGRCVLLTERFYLVRWDVDPDPPTEDDLNPFGATAIA